MSLLFEQLFVVSSQLLCNFPIQRKPVSLLVWDVFLTTELLFDPRGSLSSINGRESQAKVESTGFPDCLFSH